MILSVTGAIGLVFSGSLMKPPSSDVIGAAMITGFAYDTALKHCPKPMSEHEQMRFLKELPQCVDIANDVKLVDKWGQPLVYCLPSRSSSTPVSITELMVYSIGINGIDEGGSGDDIRNVERQDMNSRLYIQDGAYWAKNRALGRTLLVPSMGVLAAGCLIVAMGLPVAGVLTVGIASLGLIASGVMTDYVFWGRHSWASSGYRVSVFALCMFFASIQLWRWRLINNKNAMGRALPEESSRLHSPDT